MVYDVNGAFNLSTSSKLDDFINVKIEKKKKEGEEQEENLTTKKWVLGWRTLGYVPYFPKRGKMQARIYLRIKYLNCKYNVKYIFYKYEKTCT